MAMAPSARVSLMLAVVLVCALLAARPAEATGGLVCNPLQDKTCKSGDPKASENTEEGGGFGAKLPSPPVPGHGMIDGDIDDELPSFSTHKTILGHWEDPVLEV
ncbi:hypothetical protein CFC21_045393 [Triticum aestivum]|uniref:Uncharacterized protein n=2 Tax=Triticum aestivum TaxID=4565 RepID=A0A9R1JYK7_WHEAT|nr:hypothetical protein CFC21_045393 [Triticum aestivum]